jgi:hypothetical protein
MNNIKITSILIVYLLLSCKPNQDTIEINQKTTDYQITLRLSRQYEKIIGIKFPQIINIKNNSNKKETFIKIDYKYNSIPKERTYGISLFSEKEDSLIKISNNKKKEIDSYEKKQYVFYTRHFVDSVSFIQNEFKPYITKMLTENKDTLHIGTVQEFKQNHGELFKALTKNDSISIQFLDGKKLGERITVPVVW